MKTAASLREMRESSNEELKARLGRLEEELFGHRMKRYTNQLDNTMKIRQARRDIARIHTVLAARALGVESTAAKQAEE
jgi:large subunit ribosomal protein L29